MKDIRDLDPSIMEAVHAEPAEVRAARQAYSRECREALRTIIDDPEIDDETFMAMETRFTYERCREFLRIINGL